MNNPQKPNTGINETLLSAKIVLCCGEDAQELLAALRATGLDTGKAYHDFRCYRFWKFDAFTLVWTGIGTGCLEPLLYELLAYSQVKEIVLIGTAGGLPGKNLKPGDIFIANQAYLAGAAVQLPEGAMPLTPRFDPDRVQAINVQQKIAVSTDFYYGFTNQPGDIVKRLQGADSRLKTDIETYWGKADAVDMEIGQLYHLCRMYGQSELQYIAIKGIANSADAISQQMTYSAPVLESTLATALRLLGAESAGQPLPVAVKENGSNAATRLIEEIKIYWTIQLAVCAVLGYLGSNIDVIAEGAGRIGNARNFIISLVAFLLVSIGAIYNLVGNYYIRLCGYTIEGKKQEDIVSPSLAIAYFVISGIIGALITYSFIGIFTQNVIGGVVAMASGLLVGMYVHYRNARFVLRELCNRDTENIYAGEYSKKLRRIYRMVDNNGR